MGMTFGIRAALRTLILSRAQPAEENAALRQQRVCPMGIEQVLIAPRCPWQNPYAERIIGSIRRPRDG